MADEGHEDRAVLTRPAPAPTRTFAYGADPDQVADIYLPARITRPAVLLVHGGYWRPEYDRVHLRPLAAALAERGHPVVSVEYRRVPGRPDLTLDDVRAAAAALPLALPECGPDVVAVATGHSAGGHLVLWLAAQADLPAVGAALALAPVADLGHAHELGLDEGAVADFLGAHPDDRRDADPRHLPPTVPVVVIHGDRDRLVPLAVARSYAQAHDVPLATVEDAAHFAVIDPLAPAWQAVLRELDGVAAAAGIE